jgi:hypothetical protein
MSLPQRKIKPKTLYTDEFMGKYPDSSRVFHRRILRIPSFSRGFAALHQRCMAVMHKPPLASLVRPARSAVAALFPLH